MVNSNLKLGEEDIERVNVKQDCAIDRGSPTKKTTASKVVR